MNIELIALLVAMVVVVAFLWLTRDSDESVAAERLPNGTQEAVIVVERGYHPSRIELQAGVPTTLRFERHGGDACTDLLVSELWPTAHRLATHGETLVRFTPARPGRYPFTCGMGMYSGELLVRQRSVA